MVTRRARQVSDLKRELAISTRQVGQLSELKREVYRLQKELLDEKTKARCGGGAAAGALMTAAAAARARRR